MQSPESVSSRVRRAAVVFVELRERFELDLAALFSGASALRPETRLVVLAAHLDEEVVLDAATLGALAAVHDSRWEESTAVAARIGADRLAALRAARLVLCDDGSDPEALARDEAIRAGYWRPLSAIAHYHSRWSSTRVADDPRRTRFRELAEMVEAYGPPPPEFPESPPGAATLDLPVPAPSALTELARRRATCRNFAPEPVSLADCATLLHRVFAAQATRELAPGAIAVKKHTPSGGGLHPIEAQVLALRVDGLAPGLYHYQAGRHALAERVRLAAGDAAALALRAVAEQDYFAAAPVHVVLTARFARNFWKYRNHAKAYRAILLEAGHLSQMLYLAATEIGWGAYVTAAINEIDLEQALGLDARAESPLAICGFGPRTAVCTVTELDPLGAVWDGAVV